MKLLFTFFFFLFFQCSFAATYYISTNGSDENGNGSINSPWQTLYRATSAVLTPGSIIHVNAGVYTEILQCTLAVGVSLEGDGITSVLKSALTADWKEMLVLSSDTQGTNGNQHISNLKFDGQNLTTYWGIRIIGRSNVEVHHITMENFKSNGIYFDGRTDNKEGAPTVFATGNSFHDNIVNNCAAYNLSTGEYGRGALNIGGQDGMLVYNNIITQNQRPDGFNGFAIKYSLGGYNKGLKIYNNVITKKPFAGLFGGDRGWDFSIELWHCLGGLEVYGNTFQGALDLVHVAPHGYPFGAWVHDNKISQPNINTHYETGILFEKGVEGALVENNTVNNCSSGVQVYCEYFGGDLGGEPDVPYNPVIDLTIRNNKFTNISIYKGYGILFMSGPGIDADMHDVFIYNNTITASEIGKPYWGIAIWGILKATNIQIHHNTIKNFRGACINIDPASLIDKLTIENNILTGNGYANKPSFNIGRPQNYIFKNNTRANSVIFSYSNIKMNIVRPLYYTLKSTSVLNFIAFFAGIFCILFCRKENIYLFPLVLICAIINIFSSFDQDLLGEICVTFYFIFMGIYGWRLWAKRDRKNHRLVRITSSTKKERALHFVFFATAFLIVLFFHITLKKWFGIDDIPWADSLITATAFTGIWLTAKKRIESWYWWIATFAASILLYFEKNFIVLNIYNCLLLLMAVWALYKWKKRRVSKKTRLR
jgi:nicotinamide mononucleotide transporter